GPASQVENASGRLDSLGSWLIGSRWTGALEAYDPKRPYRFIWDIYQTLHPVEMDSQHIFDCLAHGSAGLATTDHEDSLCPLHGLEPRYRGIRQCLADQGFRPYGCNPGFPDRTGMTADVDRKGQILAQVRPRPSRYMKWAFVGREACMKGIILVLGAFVL